MVQEKNKQSMNIETFSNINNQLNNLINTLSEYDDAEINTGIRNLKETGVKVAGYFYKYKQKNKEE